MSGVRLESVSKRFPGGVLAVDAVDLAIEDGEFMVLVGPSGCGKTTLLRMIAGLEDATDGRISIADRDVTDVPARERDVAMVFQTYALYPHMTVRQNLGYGLRMRRTAKAEINRRVDEVAQMLGLEEMLGRKPAQLSGGQRQRVAMGRAIVREPAAFLMDEPLSNLDAKLRVGMRAQLSRLHERLGVTTVYVTHDQVEATIDGDSVSFAGFTLPLARDRRPERPSGARVILGIRPEGFEDVAFAERGLPQIDAEVAVLEDVGSDAHIIFPVAAPRVDVVDIRAAKEGEAEELLADEGALFNARVDARTSARRGGPIRLAVDPARLHFFDGETGESLLRA